MRSFIAIAACVAALSINAAMAEEAPEKDAVRIETDQAAKAFIFIIDGEPIAVLDKDGLNVAGNISYGSSLTDKGPDIKREIAERREGSAHE